MDFNLATIRNLKILNWNANGLAKQKAIFSAFLVRHNIDIACVSETHLVANQNFKVSGFNIYREDRIAPVASGGVAIFIKRSLKHNSLFLPQLVSVEATAVKVFLTDGTSVNIICAYKPPNRRLHINDISNLSSGQVPTLIIGDLNCKHQNWGCRVTNPNGARLWQYLMDSGINVSTPEEPTFYPFQLNCEPDILDILLFQNFVAPIQHKVLPELDSDHLPVVISFFLQPDNSSPPPRLITGKVDWNIFGVRLDEILQNPRNLNSTDGINRAIDHFTECLCKATKSAIHAKFPNRTNHFLTPPLRIVNLLKAKHEARRQWIRYRQPFMRRRLNQLIRQVKLEIDQYKILSYKAYLKDVNPNDSSLWQATKRILRTPTVLPPLKKDDNIFESDQDKCNILADFFEEAFSPNNVTDENTANLVNNTMTKIASTAELPIKFTSPGEIKQIIKTLPLRKSPGPDLIPNVVLKNLTTKGVSVLTSIFNACIFQNYFPDSWKKADIIVFHKPNKPKFAVSSYRPISLLSCLSKLFEKVIQKRINTFLEDSGAIPPHQFGFRPKHSTCHQIQRIVETIVRGFERKEHSTAVFLDVSQAFDKVWHEGLIHKIHNLGFPLYLKNIIKSFLNNRHFCVKINSSSSNYRPISAGVPQGSILGPLLFNIFMHDIPIPQNSTLALYADDTTIITQSFDILEAYQNLQNATNEVVNWFYKWNLCLNSNKSEAKIFTLRRPQVPPAILINNSTINWNPPDQGVKYLGVLLDKKLNFNLHINSKLNQAYSRLSILFPILNKNSTLRSQYGILIYKTILRPLLLYACQVWGTSISSTKISKLQVFQNKVIRIALNSPWFVRNSQLHREIGLESIGDFINKLTVKFSLRLPHVPGAEFFRIGQPTIDRRLKPRLFQDLINPALH
jgi:hypothetical protein